MGAGTRDPAPIKNPVLQGVGSKSKFCKLRTLHSFMGCSWELFATSWQFVLWWMKISKLLGVQIIQWENVCNKNFQQTYAKIQIWWRWGNISHLFVCNNHLWYSQLIVAFVFFLSSFDMDAFKRVYSNKDTVTEAIPYFWEHFNKEDYSIWLAEYMYDDELKRIFMSCNLVSGMFQRIEKLRKTAFASVIIFGEDGNISISGVWICRTQKLAFDVGFKISFHYICFVLFFRTVCINPTCCLTLMPDYPPRACI